MRISDWSSDVCSSDLAFEAAVDLARHLAPGIVKAVENVGDRLAVLRDEEILHRHQLGNRETVVNFDQVELFARIGDASLLIGSGSRVTGVADMAAIPCIQIGRASCRERVCQYCEISVVAV